MNGRAYKNFILAISVVPPLGVLAAIVLLWDRAVGVSDLVSLAVMYTLTGFGVTVGFHRLLTHRAFKTHKWLRLSFATLGTMAAEGPPVTWIAHHRRHHTLADREGDPHSPHLHGEEEGWRPALRGLWHAHWGWLFNTELTSDPRRYARDLVREREMLFLSRHFLAIVIAGIGLAGLIGFAVGGTLTSALTGMLWGGLVRIFLLHHVTYAINSICHFSGRRNFETEDESRNVAWLALPSFGEAWHNNHHAFPTSARHGLRWYEVDVSAGLIALLERLGLAWDVVRVEPERWRSREGAAFRTGATRAETSA